jgi:hypothetical protein
MREFFRGWKWKIGVVMLAIAVALWCGWIKGIFVTDGVGRERLSVAPGDQDSESRKRLEDDSCFRCLATTDRYRTQLSGSRSARRHTARLQHTC